LRLFVNSHCFCKQGTISHFQIRSPH
jgi:hypothetical protein